MAEYQVRPWLTGLEAADFINKNFTAMTKWQFYKRAKRYFRHRQDDGGRVIYDSQSIIDFYQPKEEEAA
jgi:hypothetical protein